MKLCARTVKACLRGCSFGECDLNAMAGPAAPISGDRYQEGIRSTVTRCANWLFNRGEGELCGAMLEELGDLGWEGIPDVAASPRWNEVDSSVGTPYLDTLDPEFRARIEARAGAVRAVGRFIRALGDPE